MSGGAAMDFVRYRSEGISPYTGEPYGIFVAVWHLIRDGMASEEETTGYWEQRRCFEEHLPVPPFYAEGNPHRAVTWFRRSALDGEMLERLGFYLRLAAKYGVRITVDSSSSPGAALYEDRFQLAVAGRGSGAKIL